MAFSYVIIDDYQEDIREIISAMDSFPDFKLLGTANQYEEGLDLILEMQPHLVFMEVAPQDPESRLSLHLVNELNRYLKTLPKIILVTKEAPSALSLLRHEVFDLLAKPVAIAELRRAVLRFSKATELPPMISLPVLVDSNPPRTAQPVQTQLETPENVLADPSVIETARLQEMPTEKPLTICVKSYGDYRFIPANEICYLQADNNSTDIHLSNGEMVTAFKTLKHFENLLQTPFVRIHNSYIVNIDFVSRIHTGNSVCYIKNTTTKLPFSKSYKENIDKILEIITKGNYLEI
jgi:two-component system, LytTR family, response regulator